MKQILAFLIVCAYVFAVIAGIGSSLYHHVYQATAAAVILGVMAFPTFKKFFKALLGKD